MLLLVVSSKDCSCSSRKLAHKPSPYDAMGCGARGRGPSAGGDGFAEFAGNGPHSSGGLWGSGGLEKSSHGKPPKCADHYQDTQTCEHHQTGLGGYLE